MAVYPNGMRTAAGFMHPYRVSGALTGLNNEQYRGDLAAQMGSRIGNFIPSAGKPDGYVYVPLMPRVAGGLSSWRSSFTITGAGDLLQGGPMEGTASLTFTSDAASLGLIITLSGTGAASFTGGGSLALTIGMAGDGAISLTGGGSLAMIVPIDGTGSFGFTGLGDLKGNIDLEGSWGGAEPLSPTGLANAVWGAIATANNDPGTMGALLNASGAAGDPWAITLEGTYTAADLIRLIAAVSAGELSGATTTEVRIRDVSDTKDRVIATVDEFGNRTALLLDAD
jgi:hypothetical protein